MFPVKVLITGGGGQLTWELVRTAPPQWQVTALTRGELDVCDPDAMRHEVLSISPNLIINAAAYTAVDKAEQESERAYAVNSTGAAHVATAAGAARARLVQISTDFVFDGHGSAPYKPNDPPNPLGVYGASKLSGERAVMEICNGQAVVLRTAWVYSSHGANFVKTMLRLMRERDEIRVVADQIGTPTWARGLAECIWAIATKPEITGLHHWTDAGVASWYDFAVAIQEEGRQLGLLSRAIPVIPIATDDYPTAARRPAYSVLDNASTRKLLGAIPPHWRASLRNMLGDLNQCKD